MEFVSDPPTSVKIAKMKQRVRWQHPLIVERGIDQTRLLIDDGGADDSEFSFLVIGDSGSGSHRGHHPQRKIAEMMLQQDEDSRFVIHTGDVIYLVGSKEYYFKNFIDPYREFLVGGEHAKRIKFDRMVFNRPFLLVPGNHDYYDLPLLYGVLAQAAAPLRYLLRSRLDFDVGWQGSQQGKAYAQAFLDYLLSTDEAALAQHLDAHYTASSPSGRCLCYQPKQFTRLPNRYYQFRYGGIDFFALDSNTFNSPLPLSQGEQGEAQRRQLEQRRLEVQQQQQQLLQTARQLNPNNPDEAEQLDDCRTKLEQLEEVEKDIDKQLAADPATVVDTEQLEWLKQRLIESWQTETVRGRVLFFHHPPYVTEATKWHQGQTLAVRLRLRDLLNQVAATIGETSQGRPLVDLVLNGHAHCLEYLQTGDTGYADANIHWIVCGGSGYSLRRQRQEGPELFEPCPEQIGKQRSVARSMLFVGRHGQGSYKRRPYSFLRIDVKDGIPPRFVIRPYVAERYRHQWYEHSLAAFEI
ncbi:MAG: metallophosphoesterase [Elainella sp. C42_A2020_010]|nr:metallophosphoesterase [Elainella sp. C42_A2020_010]RNJ70509.1 MAG: metallophosphoesterase [Leptolyngbya sp. IPPAS B-1204]